MDPFEIRLQFTRMLQRLNASVNAAKNCAAFALKYSYLDDDLHSCILEQLERSSMNNRVNILYFIDHLLEQSAKQSYDGFVCKIKNDLPQIIDQVVPEDGSGAQNVGSAKKVLLKLKERNVMQDDAYVELLNVLSSRDYQHQGDDSQEVIAGEAEQQEASHASLKAGASAGSEKAATSSQGGYLGVGNTATLRTMQPGSSGTTSGGSASSLEASPVALIPNTTTAAAAATGQQPSAETATSASRLSPNLETQKRCSSSPSANVSAGTTTTQTSATPALTTAPTVSTATSQPQSAPAPVPAPTTAPTIQNPKQIRRRAIEERMEEDRERHKRARENIWAILPPNNSAGLPTSANGDQWAAQNLPFPGHLEFEMLWNDPENDDVDEDDMERIQEDLKIKKESLMV